MLSRHSRQSIEAWLGGRRRYTAQTASQYRSYINSLARSLGPRRDIAAAARADVVALLRLYGTQTSRRRGLSALRGCFAAIYAARPSRNPIADLTYAEVDDARAPEAVGRALRRAGWSAKRIAGLTWREAVDAVLHAGTTDRAVARTLSSVLRSAFPGRRGVERLVRNGRRRVFAAAGAQRYADVLRL